MMSPFRCLTPAYGLIRAMRNVGSALILSGAVVMAQPVTIAALGDSLTQGYGLAPEAGFVPQLDAWLDEQGAEVNLINAGVSGDTTAGGLSRIEWTLTPEVDALVVALGGNDMLRGIDPAVSRANLEGIMKIAADKGLPVLLIGMDAPGNFGAEYKAAFDGIYPDLAAKYGAVYLPNFLGALADRTDARATLQDFMQADGIHPNADGVKLIVEEVGPKVLELAERARGS